MAYYIAAGMAGFAVLWTVFIYNRLVRFRNMKEEAWSGIEVQLKRRADLIPNLVEAVKGYMGHEKTVLQEVTSLRGKSLNGGTPEERGANEGLFGKAIGNLLAVAEQYPELRATENFQDLQNRLAECEEQMQYARRYYNGAVRQLNTSIQSFPNNLIAGPLGFREAQYFEIESPQDRDLPTVDFK